MSDQEDVAHLLDELVRLQARALRRAMASQTDAILELAETGFAPKRIADLLGTSYGTVSVTLAKAKKRKGGKSAKAVHEDA